MPRSERLTRKQRRELRTEAGQAVALHPALTNDVDAAMRRHPSHQAPASRGPRSTPTGGPGRGLVARARAILARRVADRFGPAIVPPLVAGAVVLVTLGVVVGLALGVILSSVPRGGWDAEL